GAAQAAAHEAFEQVGESGFGIDPGLFATPGKPARARRDVRDFLAQDEFEYFDRGLIADRAQPGDHAGRYIESTRFEHARYEGHPAQAGIRRLPGHVPESVVGIEVTIGMTHVVQARAQQAEMPRLIHGYADPVRVVVRRHAAKAVDRIPGQVDRIELDVGDGVNQRR